MKINLKKIFKNSSMHCFSFKFPMRVFALMIILFFMAAAGLLTYRGGVEIWGFFRKAEIAETMPGKFISQMLGWMAAAATFVQSGSLIWNKLSYWGQNIDNYIAKIMFHKPYFLDEVEFLLKEIRKLINKANSELLEVSMLLIYSPEDFKELKMAKHKLDNQLTGNLKKADEGRKKVVALLKKNEPYDSINRQRKARADEMLNNFTLQLINTYQKNRDLIKQSASCQENAQ